jgi:hypothetical protein
MHAVVQPWTHGFMQRALLELVLVGAVGAVLGCWVVFYELSYSAESLAHALFPGLVGAALLGLPLVLGGAVGVAAAGAGIAVFGRTPRIGRDTSVAVVVTGLFGLGVVLALNPASPPGIESLLFGDLLGVTRSDLVLAVILAAVSLVALAALHRRLRPLDRTGARSAAARRRPRSARADRRRDGDRGAGPRQPARRRSRDRSRRDGAAARAATPADDGARGARRGRDRDCRARALLLRRHGCRGLRGRLCRRRVRARGGC